MINAFRQAMLDAGLPCDSDIIDDGVLHRFHVTGDKPRTLNGWYVLYSDGIPAGEFGSWKTGMQQSWSHKPATQLTPDEKKAIYDRRAAAQSKREADTETARIKAAEEAQIIWDAAEPADTHPYTTRKGITPFCARVGAWHNHTERDVLILPVMSGKKIHSLQGIFPDGTRRFLSGGAIKGHYMRIKSDDTQNETVIICEGYATGVSIYDATGCCVVVAFMASNLIAVAKKIRQLLPSSVIIIAGDNDAWTDGNPGKKSAEAAGREINARVVIPEFADLTNKPTDFNDLRDLDAIRFQIFPPESEPENSKLVLTNISQPVMNLIFEPNECNGSGKPLATINNLRKLCDHVGLTVRYNVIKKDIQLVVPSASYSVDNATNASLAWITSACNEARMTTGNINGYLTHIADDNQYNPMVNWIDSKAWDGTDRLTALTESLGSKNPSLTAILLKKWMIGAIEAWYSPYGVDNSSVLVLQGEQNAGKTSWLKALLSPQVEHYFREGAMLNPADKDSVMGAIQYAITELGELDSTFKRADIAMLKAFITKPVDEIRRPYDKAPSKFPRRTVFCASVNPLHFLHDDKNRRFWTIECMTVNPRHGIDMQQVWAQIKTCHSAKETWKLSQAELHDLNTHNERYKAPDPVEELILATYDPLAPVRYNRLSASQVLQNVGYKSITTKDTRMAAQILKQHFGEPTGRLNGCYVYDLPTEKQ